MNIGKLLTLLFHGVCFKVFQCSDAFQPHSTLYRRSSDSFDGLVKRGVVVHEALCGWGWVRQGGAIEGPLGKVEKSS